MECKQLPELGAVAMPSQSRQNAPRGYFETACRQSCIEMSNSWENIFQPIVCTHTSRNFYSKSRLMEEQGDGGWKAKH